MALPPLASVEDLASWLGVTFEEDTPAITRAALVLDAASALVRAEAGRTWATGETLDEDVPADVIAITLRVAANMWANPTGATQRSAGPFSESYGAGLTDEDRTDLGRYRGTSGLFTISTTRCDPETESVWVPVVGSDEPLPVSLPPW